MRKHRAYYLIFGTGLGLMLAGIGWVLDSFYLVVAGVVVMAAGVATMNIPMPTIF
ncbi:MAG: hypothetical protein SWK76_08550 [Actinomycetota bacterium]|nr:hypothetical protein [Actinomycetota bacterium]